jgi:hypothetical protein
MYMVRVKEVTKRLSLEGIERLKSIRECCRVSLLGENPIKVTKNSLKAILTSQ